MTINLTKGENIVLDKGLTKVRIGLGWEAGFDLDCSAFGCTYDANGDPKLTVEKNFVYFNNLKSFDGSIVHKGDERTGATEGDDETILIDLTTTQSQEISIVVNIYDAAKTGANFGQVKKAYAKLYDDVTGKEIAKFDLTEDYSGSTSVAMGSVYKTSNGDWKFKAVGKGYKMDLSGFVEFYKPAVRAA